MRAKRLNPLKYFSAFVNREKKKRLEEKSEDFSSLRKTSEEEVLYPVETLIGLIRDLLSASFPTSCPAKILPRAFNLWF